MRIEFKLVARRLLAVIGASFALFVVSYALFGTPVSHAATGINQQINFQGRLLNAQGATVPDGYYNIQFKIYQDGDGQTVGNTTGSPAGTLKWTESHLNSAGKGVLVRNGFLSVELGSVTAFGSSVDWNQSVLWLSMNVASTNATCTPFASCSPDGEMVPMKRLSANPYALNAQNANQLGGISASGFIQSTTSVQTANIAIQSANSANIGALVQGATSQSADIFQVAAAGVATPLLAVSSNGSIGIQQSSASGNALTIKTSTGNNAFTVDATNGRVGVNLGSNNASTLTNMGLEVQGAIKITGGAGSSYVDKFVTPLGTQVDTKINIPLYDPGANNQIVAMGLASSAATTAKVIGLYDARTVAHSPTVGVYSPDQNQVFGLSWDGSNSTAYLKNTASTIALQGGGVNILTASNLAGTLTVSTTGGLQSGALTVNGVSGTAEAIIGSTGNNGKITFKNNVNANTASIQSGATANSFTTILPTDVGTAGQCLSVASVAGSTQNLGYTGCLTTANSIELQATSPGTPQTGSFNVTGTGIVGTLQANTSVRASLIKAASDQALTVSAGDATIVNANGGNLNLSGGTGNGTGVSGLVNIGPAAFNTVTNINCPANCTITQSNVDNYGTIIVSASVSDISIALPPPTNTTTKGRTIYITTSAASQDFTLTTNSGADLIQVAMRKNTTSTMIWNGTAWTPGGASNATTLQATYNNGSNPATTPEIKLDNIRGTIDIQDADTSIGTDILNVRGSNATGLGTVLFGVSNTGRVTIQGTTDNSSAFRVLNSTGDYLFNVNSANGYIINNGTRSVGNNIANPGFESGGNIANSEEGWSGPPTANITVGTLNAHTGNYSLAMGANSSNADTFAGSYYEVSPGDSISVEAWVKTAIGTNGNGGIQITWYDKDKAVIAGANTTAYPNNPGTTYVLRRANGVAPAGAQYARVSATVRSNVTTGTFYFDDFYMTRNLQSAEMTYRTSIDSTTAFRIQSAGSAQTLFTANTTDNILKVGDNTGTDTNTTLLVLDSATADPTTLANRNGGLFYRSDTNSLKAVIGGVVVDVCTTAITCTGYGASAGTSVLLQGTSPGTPQTGNLNITGTAIATKFQTQDNASGSSQSLTIKSGNATGGNSGNLIIDTGTATGTTGSITIGHTGVVTTIPGRVTIQGTNDNTITLGSSNSINGAIIFQSSAGAGTVTLRAPTSTPTTYSLTLPPALGGNGECIKTDTSGNMYFQGCGVGVNFNLQDAYNNSGTPALITLADGKDFQFIAPDTAGTDPSILINLQCGSSCTAANSNGRFAIQNAGNDVFTVSPNGQNVLVGDTSTSSTTLTLFQLDSFNGDSSGEAAAKGCSTTVNQGAMYYNTRMGSIRGCINNAWVDVSNPDTLGLLTFGIIPSSGNQPYDLPALVASGYSGPCKVSRVNNNQVHVEPCVAYSGGRRVNITGGEWYTNTPAQGTKNITLTTAAGGRWAHLCVDTSGSLNWTTTNGTSATGGMPTFSPVSPNLCVADVVGSGTSAGVIDDIYDTRTFTSAMKEAVNVSTASELGMIVDAGGTNGAMVPAVSASAKLYGTIVATDGATSAGAPNAIVTTVGPAWVKANAGTAGQFIKTSLTNGYGNTTTAIPNNSFYYSVGNTRTTFDSTCTTAANCAGSLYVNFIVR